MTETLELVWGAAAIAALIGRSRRATYQLLEQGHIPGARKIGNRWVVSRKALTAVFKDPPTQTA